VIVNKSVAKTVKNGNNNGANATEELVIDDGEKGSFPTRTHIKTNII
jgi:hypothetical protein